MKIKFTTENKGFSLIEVSLGLIVLGLLVAPMLQSYKIYVKQRKILFNTGQFTDITNAANNFVGKEGRYPIPASLTAASTDANYGIEAAGPIGLCTAWPTPQGVCSTGGANPVLIGAVPFEALGINPEAGYDFWSNKILYAITQAQTVSYTPGAGGIETQGFDAAYALGTIDTNIDMILVSHGETAQGAYTQNGLSVIACNTTAALDQENCDLDNIFILRENISVFPEVGSTNLVLGPNYYDDLTQEQQSVPADLWIQNLVDTNFALTFANRIGIGTQDPQSKMHVLGNARVENNVLSDQICESGTVDCFNPIIIAGAVPQMNCGLNTLPGNQAVINAGNSQVYCTSPVDAGGNPIDGMAFVFPAAFNRINCAALGQLMTGIDSSGNPICATP